MGQQRDRGVCITETGLALLEEARGQKLNENGKPWAYSELAVAAGISERTLLSFRDGEPKDVSTVLLICQALGLKLEQLVERGQSQKVECAPNPFGAKGVITDTSKFWGRQELLRRTFEELEKGGSRALIGPAGSGKSSILQMICRQGPERLGRSPQEFINLDMHRVRDENSFFERLCDALELEPCTQYRLERQLLRQQRRYVLCLDEIHVLSNEAFFPEPTRNWLKGMADFSNSPLQLVVASQRELRELFPDSPSRSSPLADFFDGQTTRVAHLTEAEVMAFWQEGLAGTGVAASAEKGRLLWAESRGNLRLLQRAAAKLYDELTG